MKTKDTVHIENQLYKMCQKKRIYGCEEITIGFFHQGKANERVDFATMDSKGILRCYEIKVTLADLKSHAKKSWYGHYNYLAVTPKLWNKIKDDIDTYIPNYVGVVIPNNDSWGDGIEVVRNAKKVELSCETEKMMKESMIRSMSYKIYNYRDTTDATKYKELKKKLNQSEKDRQLYYKEVSRLSLIISKIEMILRKYYNKDIDIQDFVEQFKSRKILLPETIEFQLNNRGKQVNENIKEDMRWEDGTNE